MNTMSISTAISSTPFVPILLITRSPLHPPAPATLPSIKTSSCSPDNTQRKDDCRVGVTADGCADVGQAREGWQIVVFRLFFFYEIFLASAFLLPAHGYSLSHELLKVSHPSVIRSPWKYHITRNAANHFNCGPHNMYLVRWGSVVCRVVMPRCRTENDSV